MSGDDYYNIQWLFLVHYRKHIGSCISGNVFFIENVICFCASQIKLIITIIVYIKQLFKI